VTSLRLPDAEEFVRRLGAAVRSAQLYSKGHPIIARNLEQLLAVLQALHASHAGGEPVVLGLVRDEIIVGDAPLPDAASYAAMVRRLKQIGVERITVERGVTLEELAMLVETITALDGRSSRQDGEPPAFPALPHIRVGRVTLDEDERTDHEPGTYRKLYNEAVSVAEAVWESARLDRSPDASAARSTIDGLAEAVSTNRTALLALTTLKEYDNYTFTHMVNVSLLTMGQARALGIDGALLREFGLAALMHDIGKVRTPLEILNKPEQLSAAELDIMKHHTVDGAEMLRATPDIPTLAPVVAFEHHLRLDGTGYPAGVSRSSLNLGTMLCSIADVYDAMRSQRRYQQAFPTDRILAVLKRNDGQQFDQHLVRRFVQLIGIYPPGTLVRLDTGELAVVLEAYAPDPHRPHVRIIQNRDGTSAERSPELSLWAAQEGEPQAVVAPVDPASIDVDPLTLLEQT
jgi:putative nucleotidyltransferase with HDIG domain